MSISTTTGRGENGKSGILSGIARTCMAMIVTVMAARGLSAAPCDDLDKLKKDWEAATAKVAKDEASVKVATAVEAKAKTAKPATVSIKGMNVPIAYDDKEELKLTQAARANAVATAANLKKFDDSNQGQRYLALAAESAKFDNDIKTADTAAAKVAQQNSAGVAEVKALQTEVDTLQNAYDDPREGAKPNAEVQADEAELLAKRNLLTSKRTAVFGPAMLGQFAQRDAATLAKQKVDRELAPLNSKRQSLADIDTEAKAQVAKHTRYADDEQIAAQLKAIDDWEQKRATGDQTIRLATGIRDGDKTVETKAEADYKAKRTEIDGNAKLEVDSATADASLLQVLDGITIKRKDMCFQVNEDFKRQARQDLKAHPDDWKPQAHFDARKADWARRRNEEAVHRFDGIKNDEIARLNAVKDKYLTMLACATDETAYAKQIDDKCEEVKKLIFAPADGLDSLPFDVNDDPTKAVWTGTWHGMVHGVTIDVEGARKPFQKAGDVQFAQDGNKLSMSSGKSKAIEMTIDPDDPLKAKWTEDLDFPNTDTSRGHSTRTMIATFHDNHIHLRVVSEVAHFSRASDKAPWKEEHSSGESTTEFDRVK